MRYQLRSFLFSAMALLGGGIMAQHQVLVHGHITPCSPAIAGGEVRVRTVQNTQPAIDTLVPLNPNCFYSVLLFLDAPTGWIQVSASCANGTMDYNSGQYTVNTFLDTATIVLDLTCGGITIDCNGVLNGSAVPGTPCNDGNPNTVNDTWSNTCSCTGTPACQACFTVGQAGNAGAPVPFTGIFSAACSNTGVAPVSFAWDIGGTSYTGAGPVMHEFPSAGLYLACLTIADANGCGSATCDTILVDANGYINNSTFWYDCLGVMWGNNMPGSSCDDGDPNTVNDTWSNTCTCVGTAPAACQACVQVTGANNPAGGAIPFTVLANNCSTGGTAPYTYVIDFGDGSPLGNSSTHAYTGAGTYLVCLTVADANGCTSTACDSVVVDGSGTINPNNTPDCQAGFWVLQAYTIDSLNPNGAATPIPNELWVWNLSSGGSGSYQFLWSFGDGTFSTEAFPTHIYPNGGPYELCLTLYDSNGCTDTACDSISVDNNGLYTGMMLQGDTYARSGFTIRVLNQLPTGIAERPAVENTVVWPNPVEDMLNLAFNTTLSGSMPMSIIDMNGRVARSSNVPIAGGANRVEVPVADLVQGMYLLRFGNDENAVNFRFVKR